MAIIDAMAKTSIGYLGLIIAALMLAACGGDATETPAPTPIPATIAAPASTAPPPLPTTTSTTAAAPTLAPMPTQIATEGELFLQLLNPANVEVITEIPSIEVIGRTRIDAVVTVNDSLVEPDVDGRFTSAVQLEEGPNIIEVVTSVASGEQIDLVLVVIYIP